jgi:hypothetical protein
MPKIIRPPVKTFAGEVPAQGNVAQFGSLKAGSPAYSADPAVIQALSAWGAGWGGAVLPVDSPALQDLNALFYVITRALAYYMQTGIPEWDAGQTYYINSICQSNGVVYKSLIDDNTNNAVSIDTAWVAVVSGLSSVSTDKESIQGNGTPDAPLSVAQYVSGKIAALRDGSFVRDFDNLPAGVGVGLGSSPSFAAVEGDLCFMLSWDDTAWNVVLWTYYNSNWDYIAPFPAHDLHCVAVRNGAKIEYYYIIGAGGDANHPPQWKLLNADIYNKTEADALLATKADASALSAHVGNTSNPHAVTKAQVGLGNVDNTSDVNKPVSMATAAAIASALSTAFQREFNGEIGTGVDIIPDGSAPSVAGNEGDYYFTLAYEPAPVGELPAGWLIIAWEYSDGFWDFSSQLLPIAAKDLHWVAVRNGDEVHGYYVMGAGGDVNHPPQWELIGAELSQYYTKSEVDGAIAAVDGKADAAQGTANDAIGDAAAAHSAADLAQDAADAAQTTANQALQAAATGFKIDRTITLPADLPVPSDDGKIVWYINAARDALECREYRAASGKWHLLL